MDIDDDLIEEVPDPCGSCNGCRGSPCGICAYCRDKPVFGGIGRLNEPCVHQRCYYQLEHEVRVEYKFNLPVPRGACGRCQHCLAPQCGVCGPCLDRMFFGGIYFQTVSCRAQQCPKYMVSARRPVQAKKSKRQDISPITEVVTIFDEDSNSRLSDDLLDISYGRQSTSEYIYEVDVGSSNDTPFELAENDTLYLPKSDAEKSVQQNFKSSGSDPVKDRGAAEAVTKSQKPPKKKKRVDTTAESTSVKKSVPPVSKVSKKAVPMKQSLTAVSSSSTGAPAKRKQVKAKKHLNQSNKVAHSRTKKNFKKRRRRKSDSDDDISLGDSGSDADFIEELNTKAVKRVNWANYFSSTSLAHSRLSIGALFDNQPPSLLVGSVARNSTERKNRSESRACSSVPGTTGWLDHLSPDDVIEELVRLPPSSSSVSLLPATSISYQTSAGQLSEDGSVCVMTLEPTTAVSRKDVSQWSKPTPRSIIIPEEPPCLPSNKNATQQADPCRSTSVSSSQPVIPTKATPQRCSSSVAPFAPELYQNIFSPSSSNYWPTSSANFVQTGFDFDWLTPSASLASHVEMFKPSSKVSQTSTNASSNFLTPVLESLKPVAVRKPAVSVSGVRDNLGNQPRQWQHLEGIHSGCANSTYDRLPAQSTPFSGTFMPGHLIAASNSSTYVASSFSESNVAASRSVNEPLAYGSDAGLRNITAKTSVHDHFADSSNVQDALVGQLTALAQQQQPTTSMTFLQFPVSINPSGRLGPAPVPAALNLSGGVPALISLSGRDGISQSAMPPPSSFLFTPPQPANHGGMAVGNHMIYLSAPGALPPPTVSYASGGNSTSTALNLSTVALQQSPQLYSSIIQPQPAPSVIPTFAILPVTPIPPPVSTMPPVTGITLGGNIQYLSVPQLAPKNIGKQIGRDGLVFSGNDVPAPQISTSMSMTPLSAIPKSIPGMPSLLSQSLTVNGSSMGIPLQTSSSTAVTQMFISNAPKVSTQTGTYRAASPPIQDADQIYLQQQLDAFYGQEGVGLL